MKLVRFWILLPIVVVLIIFLGLVSSDWILAAIHPGMVLLDFLIRLPSSPVVALTQATNANPASVLVVGSIALSAAIWSAVAVGFVATLRRIRTAKDAKNA
jgi:hypothetical protein